MEFKQLYLEEVKEQELKANRRLIMGYFMFFVLMIVTTIFTATGFFIIDKKMTYAAMGITSVLFLEPFYLWITKKLAHPRVKYSLVIRVCLIAGILNCFLSFHTILLYAIPLLFAVQYKDKRVLWVTFGVNTVCLIVSCFASYFYGLCDLNLFFASNHTRQWYIDYLANNQWPFPSNDNIIYVIVVFQIAPRALILLLYTIMLRYLVVTNTEDVLRIAELTYKKETDIRTRLYNKNKFEEMSESYYTNIDKIAVAYFDLNNLKNMNDRFGHDAGDEMITMFAEALFAHMNDHCKAFRVGGDEFVMVLENPSENEMNALVTAIKNETKNMNVKGKHVDWAIGMSQGQGEDFSKIVKEADYKMYENKKSMKEPSKWNTIF